MNKINIQNLIKTLGILTLFALTSPVSAFYTDCDGVVHSGTANIICTTPIYSVNTSTGTGNTTGGNNNGNSGNTGNTGNTGTTGNTGNTGNTGSNTTVANNPYPTVSSLSQTSASAGSGSTIIMLTGANFIPGSFARWNGGNRSTVYVNSQTLQMVATSSDLSTTGSFPITVFNPTPGGGTSNAITFTVSAQVNNNTPIITSITPNSTNSGASATTITVRGQNFDSRSIVRWNSSDRQTSYVDGTTLTALLTVADMSGSGHYQITVYNPANSTISNSVFFTINGSSTGSAVAGSTAGTTGATTSTTGTKTTTTKSNTSKTSGNSLSANALFGENGFLPHNLFQWIYVFLLILLGVIFYRKIYMDNPENKHAPLKHH